MLEELNIASVSNKVFSNPDTSCPYTRIPLGVQKELLKGILSNPETHILLNCGFTFEGIEKELLNEIPSSCSKRVTIIPMFS
jgi:hypothetical protein